MKPLALFGTTLLLVLAAPVGRSASCGGYEPDAGATSRSAVLASLSDDNEYSLNAINQLGIRYARGRGVAKDNGIALGLFKILAVEGYTPGMVNLGISYEVGLNGRRDHRRAYAWIRAALAIGVPEEEYEATLFKLGMVAGKLGIARLRSADRLAVSIAEGVLSRRQSSGQGELVAHSRVDCFKSERWSVGPS